MHCFGRPFFRKGDVCHAFSIIPCVGKVGAGLAIPCTHAMKEGSHMGGHIFLLCSSWRVRAAGCAAGHAAVHSSLNLKNLDSRIFRLLLICYYKNLIRACVCIFSSGAGEGPSYLIKISI